MVLLKALEVNRVCKTACRELGFCGEPMFEALVDWQQRFIALMATEEGSKGDVEGLWRLVEMLYAHAWCVGGGAPEPFRLVLAEGNAIIFEDVPVEGEMAMVVTLEGGRDVRMEAGYAGAICMLWHTTVTDPVRDFKKNLMMKLLVPRKGAKGRRKREAGGVYKCGLP